MSVNTPPGGARRHSWRSTAILAALSLIGVGVLVVAPPTSAADVRTMSVGDALSTQEGNNGLTDVVITLSLDGPANGDEVAHITTSDAVGMVSDLDYLPLTDLAVPFTAGETTAQFTVQIVGDTFSETNEAFGLTITSAANALIGDAAGSVFILNDDEIFLGGYGRPAINNASVTALEGATSHLVFPLFSPSFVSTAPCGVRVTFTHVSTDDADFVTPPTFVDHVYPAGAGGSTVTIDVAGNGDASEPTETISATLSSQRIGSVPSCLPVVPLGAVGTITSVGLLTRTINVLSAGIAEGDSGSQLFTMQVQADGPMQFKCAYDIVITGADEGDLVSTIVDSPTFEQDAQLDTFTVEVVGDTVDEGDVQFTATPVVGGDQPWCVAGAAGIGTIADNDAVDPPPPDDACVAGDRVTVTWPNVTLGRTPSATLVRTADAAVELPEGRWSVTLTSTDPSHPTAGSQSRERWNIRLLDGTGQQVDSSWHIADLPTSATSLTRSAGIVDAPADTVTTIRAAHILSGTKSSSWGSTQSVRPAQAVLTCLSPV